MSQNKKQLILNETRKLFARSGIDGFSMRKLANACDVSASVLYHYFPDKDLLLQEMYHDSNKQLGLLRQSRKWSVAADARLRELLLFQFEHAELVVAVLKYYMAYRYTFEKNRRGFLPDKAYLHIDELLQAGVDQGVFDIDESYTTAKVMTHAINGYLLEYYPYQTADQERADLANEISTFLLKAIRKRDLRN